MATGSTPIINRALLVVFASTLGTATSFFILLSAVPLYAVSTNAGGRAAGLITGTLMLSTVAGELATSRLVTRFGYRYVLATGLVLLGAPAFALTASASIVAILIVSLVRGLGLGMNVVVANALVASLVPPERRGEAFGLYGLVVGIPSVVVLPLGVWIAIHAGYSVVFVIGGVSALVPLIVVPALSGREQYTDQPVGVMAALRTLALLRPLIAFSATAMAAGIVVTFIPLAVTKASGNVAAAALLAQSVAATACRWWGGRYGDRHGSARLLAPGVFAAGLGMLGPILGDTPIAVVAGMILFGAGFGISQNASVAMMFDRVQESGYGAVSAMWNLAYDVGLGLGAAGFGLVAAKTGYPAAFAVTGLVVMIAAVPAFTRSSGSLTRRRSQSDTGANKF